MYTTNPESAVISATQRWLERAVIGLNLCPFAKAVHAKGQIRYVVSSATTPEALADDLLRELEFLAEANAEQVDTTLLIHPQVLTDFLDFNDYLDVADGIVHELELDGILQVASFHPQFQFEDTEPDDITNYTNRSPYPTLHLLRRTAWSVRSRRFRRSWRSRVPTLQRLKSWAMTAGKHWKFLRQGNSFFGIH